MCFEETEKNDYVIIPIDLLTDERLSSESKVLYGLLQMRLDDGEFTSQLLLNVGSIEDSKKYFIELMDLGYILNPLNGKACITKIKKGGLNESHKR
ncbi:MAG: hypothetical protein KAU20_05590 [Nanoarchaeota archaeon]|nr:hypothetical protein [Nanoarchaeota archaeon]